MCGLVIYRVYFQRLMGHKHDKAEEQVVGDQTEGTFQALTGCFSLISLERRLRFSRIEEEGVCLISAYLLLWDVQDSVDPVAVLLPRFLFVDLVSVRLRQGQEPSDGAQVLPQSAVLRAGVFLPPEQLTQPTLEHRI